ncbi:MAG: NUDIX hydrolase [Pseudomonadota bacterium]
MEDQWLSWAKRLQAIATIGCNYSESSYDTERYEQVLDIATQMLSSLSGVPISQIGELSRSLGKSYVTPQIDVRGAVIVDESILLVQEATDGLWTLPGGFADVGLSAAENVEKEVLEEAGLEVSARTLYAIRHKAKHDYDADFRDFYKIFFLCDCVGPQTPSPGSETKDAKFFRPTELPELSTDRVLEKDIVAAFRFNPFQLEFD